MDEVVCIKQREHPDGCAEHQYHHGVRQCLADCSGGYGTVALDGVSAVCLHVDDVVEAVDARGGKGEAEEGDEAVDEQVDISEVSAEEEWQEDEGVLYPLVWTENLY